MKITFTDACPGLIESFRGLNMLALWFSLFYFLAVSIGVAVSVAGSPAFPLLEIVFSPMPLFIGIDLVSILFPFFNIHRAPRRLKREGLDEIALEYDGIRSQRVRAVGEKKGMFYGWFTLAEQLSNRPAHFSELQPGLFPSYLWPPTFRRRT